MSKPHRKPFSCIFTNADGQSMTLTVEEPQDVEFAEMIYHAADDEGTIQARESRELFTTESNHRTMNLDAAFRIGGFTPEPL